MANNTFGDFLLRGEAAGIIDYSLRVVRSPQGHIDFYIHPIGRDGETGDFEVVNGYMVCPIPNNMGAGSARPGMARKEGDRHG